MLLTNRWIPCDEAYRFGLVNRMVPKGDHVKAADEMALKIASFDPHTVRLAKEAIIKGNDMSLQEGLELEKRLILQRRSSEGDKTSVTT
jgi:enoyl-CoA hydratase/carnithine racemase